MKIKLVVRALSAAFLGILFGLYVHHDYLRSSQMGIESFLAKETVRFNKYMAVPQAEVHTLITFTIAALLVAAIYELVVVFVYKLVKIPR